MRAATAVIVAPIVAAESSALKSKNVPSVSPEAAIEYSAASEAVYMAASASVPSPGM